MTDDLSPDRLPFRGRAVASRNGEASVEAPITASRRIRVLLAISGALPLLGLASSPPTTALLIYSVFVTVWFWRRPLVRAMARNRWPEVTFFVLMLAWGWLAELFAWTNEYLTRDPQPALFHPQLGPDLLLVSGLFLGWAAAWAISFRLAAYSLGLVFASTGLLGVCIEENGAVLRSVMATALVNPAQSAIMAVYVFALYGSVPGLAVLALEQRLRVSRRRAWWRIPVAIALLFVAGKAGAWVVRLLAEGAGLVPPPRPIWE